MIIHKVTKEFQIRSDFPNSFWMENQSEDDYFVIQDGSEIANKILQNHPYFSFILDENQSLIDIEIKEDEKNKKNQEQVILNQIRILKSNLNRTDYHAIKFAEGYLTAEEFSEMKEQRQLWRDEINALEAELEELNV